VRGLANTIVNNHFDFSAFRGLSYDQIAAQAVVSDPYFENVGHAYEMTYGNNVLVLAATTGMSRALLKSVRQASPVGQAMRPWPAVQGLG
jgi:hypothetical protein